MTGEARSVSSQKRLRCRTAAATIRGDFAADLLQVQQSEIFCSSFDCDA
jgi:hypothetical protein